MPQPELTDNIPIKRKHANAEDVFKAGKVGDAIFAYYLKHGKMPTDPTQVVGMSINEQSDKD